ncbi:MAG: hypothetical protein ACM3NQ_15160 [Bacteroidales bacterium]
MTDRRRVAVAVTALIIAAAGVALGAFESRIDASRIDRAIALGRAGDAAARQRFHDAYVVRVGDPELTRVEVVTEFRRVVLAAEQRSGFGDATFSRRDAENLLRPFRNTVSIVVYLRFPPQNAYRAMPDFQVVVYDRPPASGRLLPRDTRAVPQYVSGQLAPPGSPLLGGSVEATFDARRLDPRGIYLIGVGQQGRELRRIEVDFGRIE